MTAARRSSSAGYTLGDEQFGRDDFDSMEDGIGLFRRDLERLAEAVVELTDTAGQARLRQIAKHGQTNPLFEHAVMPSELRPASVPVAQMKLRAALASLPSGGLAFPKCRALLDLDPDELGGIASNEALDEVGEALSDVASARAAERSRASETPLQRWGIQRSWHKAGIGNPWQKLTTKGRRGPKAGD